MSSKSGTRETLRIGGLAVLTLAFVSVAAGCAPESSVKKGTGGKSGVGGAAGGGGVTGTGGTTGSGGAAGTGGALGGGGAGTGGGGGDTTGAGGDGGGGTTGTGGDTGGSGVAGAGGTGFLLRCDIATNTDFVFNAAAASNMGLITDFPFVGGGTGFGDFTNTVSGFVDVQPAPIPPAATGGAGGGGGAGGRGGAAGGGGRGGAGGGAGGAPLGNLGLTEDFTGGSWHISGTISNAIAYDLARVRFGCIVDASAYAGVQFTIGGNGGPAGSLTLQAGFSGDEIGSTTVPGQGTSTCLPAGCGYPFTVLTVPSAVTTVQLPWSRFTGGRPISAVDPHQLIQFLWTWNRTAVPYNVDITIDDLRFYSAPMDGGATD